jgi:hypothetical protein
MARSKACHGLFVRFSSEQREFSYHKILYVTNAGRIINLLTDLLIPVTSFAPRIRGYGQSSAFAVERARALQGKYGQPAWAPARFVSITPFGGPGVIAISTLWISRV